MGRLVVHDRARADLDEIADYIARDDLDAAIRFYDAARRALRFLSDFPGAGASHSYFIATPSPARYRDVL